MRKHVRLHQLRPLLPPESYWSEFRPGDEVDVFHNNGWWEGHIVEDLGHERFIVCFRNSTTTSTMMFQKEEQRTHRKWMIDNNNWIFSYNSDHNKNKISELSEDILIHIMNFMDTKEAVRTCVLSKRWKNLCKSITHLSYSSPYHYSNICDRFAMWVLSSRDDSHSLLNLTIDRWSMVDFYYLGKESYLDRIMHYALSHNVQDLTILNLQLGIKLKSLPLICCSNSLTSLKLCCSCYPMYGFPKSLHMPALKNLYLEGFNFSQRDYNNNDIIEPFSNCGMLDTLSLVHPYSYHKQVFCISSLTLSTLTIKQRYGDIVKVKNSPIVLSTPNLRSYTMEDVFGTKPSSTCHLSFIEQVNIDIEDAIPASLVISWLQIFSNVKTLTLTAHTIYRVLSDCILEPNRLTPIQPPCFVRLQSLIVKNEEISEISEEEVIKAVTYLLQNSSFKARLELIFSNLLQNSSFEEARPELILSKDSDNIWSCIFK